MKPRRSPRLGQAGYERIPHDFYPTPPWVTKILVNEYYPRLCLAPVWEPAAGDGRMAVALEDEGIACIQSDVQTGKDFLSTTELPAGTDCIVTNPPYRDGMAERFVRHALDLTKPVNGFVAMLLNVSFDTAGGRVDLFRHRAFAGRIVLTKRIRWIEGTTGSPRENHAWFVWDWVLGGVPVSIYAP